MSRAPEVWHGCRRGLNGSAESSTRWVARSTTATPSLVALSAKSLPSIVQLPPARLLSQLAEEVGEMASGTQAQH
ncbi:hypothetical protein [Novosphingobium sp. KN65.2]|uniref:hypothetical protein n=1 Tax=Novosphingobium sp. KN65.2 TaxID=1478134 RepID=UPI0012E28569|nr:hypothetical protein [Novosphingobium sp. KN65.2]